MIRNNPCYDTMTPAGQIVNKVMLQDTPPPHNVDGYEEWFIKYNTLNGCPPIHIATRDAWKAAIDYYESNKK